MRRKLNVLLALIKGKAIVIAQGSERESDVLVGRRVTKRYALNSLYSTLKAMAL